MILSRALSCFEEGCALALAFGFLFQKQKYAQSLSKLYSLVGKGTEVTPLTPTKVKTGHWTSRCTWAQQSGTPSTGEGRRENCGGYLLALTTWYLRVTIIASISQSLCPNYVSAMVLITLCGHSFIPENSLIECGLPASSFCRQETEVWDKLRGIILYQAAYVAHRTHVIPQLFHVAGPRIIPILQLSMR